VIGYLVVGLCGNMVRYVGSRGMGGSVEFYMGFARVRMGADGAGWARGVEWNCPGIAQGLRQGLRRHCVTDSSWKVFIGVIALHSR